MTSIRIGEFVTCCLTLCLVPGFQWQNFFQNWDLSTVAMLSTLVIDAWISSDGEAALLGHQKRREVRDPPGALHHRPLHGPTVAGIDSGPWRGDDHASRGALRFLGPRQGKPAIHVEAAAAAAAELGP